MFDRKEEGRSGMVLELNPEQKQRVNLSLHAQEILEADREQFAPHLTKNGFFNELLYRFAPQAGASISQTLERRRQTILLQLESLRIQKKRLDSETAEAVTEALLSPVRKELEMKAASYPKGTSVLFRLSNRKGVRLPYPVPAGGFLLQRVDLLRRGRRGSGETPADHDTEPQGRRDLLGPSRVRHSSQ